jgi:hypothetical protein
MRVVAQKPKEFFLLNREAFEEKVDKTQFGTTNDGEEESYLPGSYEAMCSLLGHREDSSKIFWVIVSACFNLQRLRIKGYFGSSKNNPGRNLDKEETLVGAFLVKFLQILQYNTHAILEQVSLTLFYLLKIFS